MLELFLAMHENLSVVYKVGSFCGVLGFVFSSIALCHAETPKEDSAEYKKNEYQSLKKVQLLFGTIALPCLLLAAIPSVDELLKIRIALIKYELASGENISRATDVIERIGEKLECKYLGCEENK